MVVQSVLIPVSWTLTAARQWIADHNYSEAFGIHTTDKYHRFRQYNPDSKEIYRSLKVRGGIILVVALNRVARGGRVKK